MEIISYDTIDRIGAARIEALGSSGLDFSFGLLRAIERSLWGGLKVRYVAAEAGSELIAFTPVYLGTNLNFNALMPSFVQRAYRAQVDQLGLGAAYTVAVVGCLISDRGWIPMRSDEDAPEVVPLLIREIDRLARAENAKFCLVKDIHSSFPSRSSFQQAGYTQVFSLPTVRVPTAFGSFEEYLQALSKNGRKHARKTYRHAEGRLRLRTLDDYEELVPAVYPFFRSTFLKAKFQFEELTPEFFAACAYSRSPHARLIVCERNEDGRLVGALLLFHDAREQLSKRIGIDYATDDTALIYNLLMYEGLRHAVEHGIGAVYLGQSTYVPKTRMGGQLEDQFLFLKCYSLDLRATLPLQRLWLERYRSDRVMKTLHEAVLE